MEISFTRFRIYLECPWKYKLFFNDRKKIPLTPSSSLGISLHRALERFHRQRGADLEALLDAYEEEWVGGGYSGHAERDEFFSKGRRMLEKYIAQERERRTEIYGVEKEFIYPLGSHTVRGMIDRMDRHPDGSVEVIDYKTRLDAEAEEALSENLQLRFYALGVHESLGIKPGLLTVHSLAAGKRASIPYDDSGEDELKERILKAADSIEAGKFPPDTSFCRLCDYRKTCTHSIVRD